MTVSVMVPFLCLRESDNKSINDWMLKNKMAISYDGKKKSTVNWASYYEENKFCEFKDF